VSRSGAPGGSEKRLEFTYDPQGRRVSKKVWNNTTGSGNPVVDQKFVYDGWGRLRKRVEYVLVIGESLLGGGSWSPVSETRYVYDGRRVIQERNGSNNPTVSYTRGE